MFANGSLKPQSKCGEGGQSASKHFASNASKEQKQSCSRNQAQAFRNTTNLPKVDEQVLSNTRSSKYANPYIYHRKNASKNMCSEEGDSLQKMSSFGRASETQIKLRHRDSSEHAALQSRDFKHSGATLPNLNNSRLSRKFSDYGPHKAAGS